LETVVWHRFYFFRRAPGFFDVVAYTGTGANRTVSHNLGVAPELIIVKRRNTSGGFGLCITTLLMVRQKACILTAQSAFTTSFTYGIILLLPPQSFSVGTNSE
jgi:hypothetical protein